MRRKSVQGLAAFGIAAGVACFWWSCGIGTAEEALVDRGSVPQNRAEESVANCDVLVAGGTTAALFAALTASREGTNACLLEPTNWPGGQLTASAVSAVDFAWHKVGELDVAKLGKDPRNIPREFQKWMVALGNPGGCWVSRNCFEPKKILIDSINPTLARQGQLKVYLDTVVKSVKTVRRGDVTFITELEAIQRFPSGAANQGYDRFLSQDLADWYSRSPSARFDKKILTFRPRTAGADLVFIDATEWGEVLALSGADYLIGVERTDGQFDSQQRCGQATVYPLVMDILGEGQSAVDGSDIASINAERPEFFGLGRFTWEKIWTYRRVKGAGEPGPGQSSLQNWNPGNDYPFRYLFKDKAATAAELSDWNGGVDVRALEGAEKHAIGWFKFFRDKAPASFKGRIALNRNMLGTSHGLSKVPYIRDTRRSIGLDGFVVGLSDMQGSGREGTKFPDRIGLGAYAVDIHGLSSENGCFYPEHAEKTLPFYLPLRAHTNRNVGNLLVAGKTIAQTFLANAATRLHPIEASSGIGAGAAAAVMTKQKIGNTRELLSRQGDVQNAARKYGPLDWSF